MTTESQSLVFTHTPATLAASIAFVLVVVGVSWMAWQRSGFRTSTGLLEGLRVFIALCVAVTLNQPEWRELFKPESKPALVILNDVSRSMQTRDVIDPNNPKADAKSRAETAQPMADLASWHEISQKMDVVVEPFSSSEEPAEDGTDINAALTQALEKHSHLGAIVLLSDGDWNSGLPPAQAATRLRMRGAPVFTVPLGSETRLPGVELTSFQAPIFAIAGKPLRIPFTIESSLPRDESATLEMKTTTGEVITKAVVIPAMSRLQDVITWKPEKPGDTTLTLTVPPVGEEHVLGNHSIEAPISIRREQLHVLLVESYPRWEYRYLRNALQRDPGVDLNSVLFHPDLGKMGVGKGYLSALPKDDALTKYDVVFIGDVGVGKDMLTVEQCAAFQKLVRDQAAGLVFLPGVRGNEISLETSALADLLPILWDEAQPHGFGTSAPGNFVLTEVGTHSLLTKLEDTDEASAKVWETLPGFQWYAPVLRAKAGAEVLATHRMESNHFGRVPLIVTKTYGAGKILFMGTDGAWRWRKGVEDQYHYRFWGQVVRWMAYQRNMSQGDKMRLFYSPDRPISGAAITLNANVTSLTGEPLRDGAVIAQITAPSGKTSSVRLNPAGEDAWGLFTGVFTPIEPGEHHVHLTCVDAGSALDSAISVQGSSREKLGQPAKFDVLREIAQITRGRMLDTADPAALRAAIAALPQAESQERRIQLWAHPAWAGFIVLLLCVFWSGRKAIGSF